MTGSSAGGGVGGAGVLDSSCIGATGACVGGDGFSTGLTFGVLAKDDRSQPSVAG